MRRFAATVLVLSIYRVKYVTAPCQYLTAHNDFPRRSTNAPVHPRRHILYDIILYDIIIFVALCAGVVVWYGRLGLTRSTFTNCYKISPDRAQVIKSKNKWCTFTGVRIIGNSVAGRTRLLTNADKSPLPDAKSQWHFKVQLKTRDRREKVVMPN